MNIKSSAIMRDGELINRIFQCANREEKKQLLASLSETIKPLVEQGIYAKVNEGLIDLFKTQEHTTFHTFKEWKEKGFKVVKGSKAFFIWSKPRRADKKTQQQEEADKKEEQSKTYKFYGIAYLFSNAQVTPITLKKV